MGTNYRKPIKIEPGERFGNFTVVAEGVPKRVTRLERRVIVRCVCGKERIVSWGSLRSGRSKSCGCVSREELARRMRRHGVYRSKLYRAWQNMKERCGNPSNAQYANYGGRGIQVCERWLADFINFYEDIGDPPSEDHSLDRINNNGNYEPGNCRWATRSEQQANRRTTRLITFEGRTQSLAQWRDEWGVSIGRAAYRAAKIEGKPWPYKSVRINNRVVSVKRKP